MLINASKKKIKKEATNHRKETKAMIVSNTMCVFLASLLIDDLEVSSLISSCDHRKVNQGSDKLQSLIKNTTFLAEHL